VSDCTHIDDIATVDGVVGAPPGTEGCIDCLAIGARWVHLRRCLECGHVGCCDSSPNKHATAHFHTVGHPLVQSFEPGEEWIWCYADDTGIEFEGLPPSPSHP
jgi:uncharacterized UBP type Zn finger protein